MTMPSVVSIERVLLRSKARAASMNVCSRFMLPSLARVANLDASFAQRGGAERKRRGRCSA